MDTKASTLDPALLPLVTEMNLWHPDNVPAVDAENGLDIALWRGRTARVWARDAAIEKKDMLKARGYAWSAGEFGRPKCWYRDVLDADRAAEVSWLRTNVMGPGQAVWALRITARHRYSDRCWGWGEREQIPTVVPSLPLGTVFPINQRS
jgi:hypothetical protein